VHDFRKLRIWRASIDLAADVYQITYRFPRRELYGLAAQMRSSAVSISSNIAEGAGRGSDKEMARFLRIALGSLSELESQFELASRLLLISTDWRSDLDLHSLRKQIRRLHDQMISAAK
jgi:four helix bundle protein